VKKSGFSIGNQIRHRMYHKTGLNDGKLPMCSSFLMLLVGQTFGSIQEDQLSDMSQNV